MEVEIELRTGDPSFDIYSLRKELEESFEGLHLEVQSQPAQEGQMNLDALGTGMIHGLWGELGKEGVKLLIQQGTRLYKYIREWQKNRIKQQGTAGETMPPGITLGDGNKKIYVTEDKGGNIQVFDNFDFAVDTNNTYALLIGNSEFDGNFPSIPPVKNNLDDFYDLLTDKRHVGLPRKNVKKILNKTDHEIEEMMLKTSRMPDMETLLIYYSGHGHKAELNNLVLTARNTKKVGDDIVGGIDFNFITEKVLKRSTAKQKLLILDACHSGLATQGDFDLLDNFDVKGTYILTSSGDEASYFEKQAQHTFFTGTLLNLLNKGVAEETKEMISLEDLYDISFKKLAEDKFPVPHCKNQLNIPASFFFIARNPAFSEEKFKQRPLILKKEGKVKEALDEYQKLVRRYPDDDQLRKHKDECQDEMTSIQLAYEGDNLFHKHGNYKAAAEKYKEALKYKKGDSLIIGKLRECQELIAGKPDEPVVSGTLGPGSISPEPGIREPAKNDNDGGKKHGVPPPINPPVVTALPVQEIYQYGDNAVTVIFQGQPDKKPLEIPYKNITTLRYTRNSNKVMVTYRDTNRFPVQEFRYSAKEDAIKLKNFLVAKAELKKNVVKNEKGGEILGAIVVWIIICVVYILITNWAKGYLEDNKGSSGIVYGLANILGAIGSFITPAVAMVIAAIAVVITIIAALDEASKKNAEETYSR